MSEQFRPQSVSSPNIRGSSVGNAAVRGDKFRENREAAGVESTDTSALRLLSRVVEQGSQLAGQAIQRSATEAYLNGAAQAGTARSEDDLEADIFTRAWATQGYRDTMGRVTQAEVESRILTDMPKMREASPEKYNEYLAERRSELLPALEGMSLTQRASATQNILMNERAAIKRHAGEHAKFIVETEDRSVKGIIGVNVRALSEAKSDGPSYKAQTEKTLAALYGNVVLNEKLPLKVKERIVGEAMQFALQSDHLPLYELFQNEAVALPDGTKGPLASMLTWDDQVSIGKAYRESLNRTEAIRAQNYTSEQARMEADWDNPDTPPMQEQAMLDFASQGIERGFMKSGEQKSFQETYYKAMLKKVGNTDLATAWEAGDLTKMLSLNKTDEEGQDAWMATMGRKLKPAELTSALINIGVYKGRPAALKQLGTVIGPALAQIGLGDDMDPGSAQALGATILTLDKAERDGRSGLFSTIMQTYPPELQAKMSYIREGVRQGLSPTMAISQAQARIAEEDKMTPQERAAMGAAHAKDNADIVNSMEPRSFADTLWLKAKSLVSSDAANQLAVTPRSSWFENEERVAEAGAAAKFAMLEELRAGSASNPFMGVEARKTSALARLAARTVETEHGPFILPRGTSVQQFFGVPASTGKERVGAALNEYVKPADGNRLVFRVDGSGKFTFKELSKEGAPVRDGILDPRMVAPMVAHQQEKEIGRYKEESGPGIQYNGYKFNGDNTVGLGNRSMLEMRKFTLDSPHFSFKFEDEAKGNHAIKLVTNEAGKVAKELVRQTRKPSQPALNLFAEMAISTDMKVKDRKDYRPLLVALSGTDEAAAQTAMRGTTLYKSSKPERQALYDSMIQQIMRGY